MPYNLPEEFRLYTPAPGTPKLGKLETAYVPAYQAWKANDTAQTRASMLQALQPVISRAMTSYGGSGSPTLKSHAKILALAALPSYDPNRGRLDTHLLSHLQGLQRIGGKQQQLVAIPERLTLDNLKLKEVEAELEDNLGRLPTTAELQRATGLSRKRIEVIRRVSPGVAAGSLNRNVSEEAEDLVDPASRIPGDDTRDAAWIDFVYEDLPPTDQLIMERLLGLHGTPKLSVQQLAKKLGLTSSAISQRASRIQQLLDKQDLLFGA